MKRNRVTVLWDTAKTSVSKWIRISTLKIYFCQVSQRHLRFLQDSQDNRRFHWLPKSHLTRFGVSSQAVVAGRTDVESPSMRLTRLFWNTLAQTKIYPTIGFPIAMTSVTKWKYQLSTLQPKARLNSLPERPLAILFVKTRTRQYSIKTSGQLNSHPIHHKLNH